MKAEVAKPRNTEGCQQSSRSREKNRTDSPLQPSGGASSTNTLTLGFVASRTVRKKKGYTTCFVKCCNSNFRKLIHHLCIIFSEVAVQIFYPCFLLLLSFKSSLYILDTQPLKSVLQMKKQGSDREGNIYQVTYVSLSVEETSVFTPLLAPIFQGLLTVSIS